MSINKCFLSQTEQLKDLNQELIKQEEQLKEVKKNSTTLERKLEYERYVTTARCGVE